MSIIHGIELAAVHGWQNLWIESDSKGTLGAFANPINNRINLLDVIENKKNSFLFTNFTSKIFDGTISSGKRGKILK
jgi:hypothetical protein